MNHKETKENRYGIISFQDMEKLLPNSRFYYKVKATEKVFEIKNLKFILKCVT